jgi:acyl carrier protein
MTIWVERDSLSFKRWRIIRCASPGPISNIAGITRWRIDTTTGGSRTIQAFSADVQDRILALVKSILEQNSITAEVDPDSRLVDVGLTSMDMVNLMLGVEAEFDFTIPQSEITPENFQSVKTLQRMIVSQLEPATAA